MVVLSGTELLKTVRFEGSGSTRHSPVVKLTASMGDRYELLFMFFMVETADPVWLPPRPAVCTRIGLCIELKSSKNDYSCTQTFDILCELLPMYPQRICSRR